MPPILPHSDYYMKDGVSFQVQDVLFRVPRYMLESSSPIFSNMLENVGPADAPLVLPNVKSKEFEHLLTFLYPLSPHLLAGPKRSPSCSDEVQQWTSILRLAAIWDMQKLRIAAMDILSRFVRDPMTKVALGKQYNHISWMREGFTILCIRPETLSIAEARQLTKEDIIACATASEGIRALKGIKFPVEGSPSVCQEYDALLTNHYVCKIVEDAFPFFKEDLAEKVDSKSTPIKVEIKETFDHTNRKTPSFQFIPNVVAPVTKEIILGQQRLIYWCKGFWEPRLLPYAKSNDGNPTGMSAVKEYLAGLLLLTMGVLVITW